MTPDVAGFAKQHGPHSQFECTAVSGGANTNLDCDDPFPNNEPDIEVDPTAAGHMIASSNDFGTCCDQMYTTFDNGASWITGNISRNSPQVTGSDPVTVFDRKHGVAIHSSLNYSFQNSTGEACRGDLVVSVSTDGGVTWAPPTVVDNGLGCDLSNVQLFNDKEWIVTDNIPVFALLRPHVSDLDEVRRREWVVHRVADLRVALGRRRQALVERAGDLRVERVALHRSDDRPSR